MARLVGIDLALGELWMDVSRCQYAKEVESGVRTASADALVGGTVLLQAVVL